METKKITASEIISGAVFNLKPFELKILSVEKDNFNDGSDTVEILTPYQHIKTSTKAVLKFINNLRF